MQLLCLLCAAPAPSAGDVAAKDVKRVNIAGADDGQVETEEQKAARIEDVKKTLEEINKEDPRCGLRRRHGIGG